MIRKLLTQSHVSPSDRRAQFVGAEAYEQAGGIIFFAISSSKTTAATTPTALLDRLVLEKLEDRRGGVAGGLEVGRGVSGIPVQLRPRPAPHLPAAGASLREESTKLDELVTRHDALIAEHGEDAPDDVVAELDRLAEEIAAIHRRSETYLPEDLSRAGAIVSLSSEGALRVERGFIKPEDAVQPSSSDEAEAPSDSKPTSPVPTGTTTMPNGAEPENGKALVQPAHRAADRRAHRGAAGVPGREARGGVDGGRTRPRAPRLLSPGVPGRHLPWARSEDRGAGTFAPSVNEAGRGTLARRHEDWSRKLPTESAELWSWVIGQDTETLLGLLAYCAARTIDAVQRSWERNSRRASRRSARAHGRPRHGRVVGADARELFRSRVEGAHSRSPRGRLGERRRCPRRSQEGSDDRACRALALRQALAARGAAQRQRSRFGTCVCITNRST